MNKTKKKKKRFAKNDYKLKVAVNVYLKHCADGKSLILNFWIMQSPKSVEILEMEMKQMKETINKIDENVSKISSFIFEGGIEQKFVSQKTFELTVDALNKELDQKQKTLDDLKSNQAKVIRIVITAVLTAVIGLVIKTNVL